MQDPHGELASLLKSWRERLSPGAVGLPAGTGRRATGLRREELAALAGLSVDYVVRLEQGRARNPSDQVAASLARALQLTDHERDHLYRVVGLLPPGDGIVSNHIPPSVQRLIARLGETPVAVFSATWDLLTWSPLWAALLGDPSLAPARERNLVRAVFAGSDLAGGAGFRVRQELGTEHFQGSLVCDLREVQGRYPGDPAVRSLIDGLMETSELFRTMWASGSVGTHVSEHKYVTHPLVGEIELDCDVFSVAGSDLRIVAYTVPAGSPEESKLDLVRVAGLTAAARP
ncbi:helix-turn-helix protein [Frondihabitans sp. PhB188]|uniref:helix-turn-helix transcriptional regulator n=1 Tax=Frondihabitans sp. PhB188 TaxID=2485200 RepID=UPI000F48CD40|nr:helix-turn-helix transcriptional regulator [Frondihabitans sp. PhB188]ROQ39495.1 helix-turn-helix protein [Frondihabitans sp. PhB188]